MPPYCWEEGGAVVNSTIDRYAYATFEPGGEFAILESSDMGIRREYPVHPAVPGGGGLRLPYDGELDLLKAAANVAGAEGGFRLTTYSQAPPGSGMGGSSSLAVAIIGAMAAARGGVGRMDAAMLAYRAEREELGQRGGYQDQLAAAHGGFNYMEFSRSGISVVPLRLDRWVVLELEARSILLYTGRGRLSSRIHEDVDRRNREDPGAGAAYREELRRVAREMRSALERGDLGGFGELLREGWEAKRRMSPLVSDDLADRAYARAMELGAEGGKVLGAGGGGHLFLFAEPERRGAIIRELEGMGLVNVPFSFELEGGLVTWRI